MWRTILVFYEVIKCYWFLLLNTVNIWMLNGCFISIICFLTIKIFIFLVFFHLWLSESFIWRNSFVLTFKFFLQFLHLKIWVIKNRLKHWISKMWQLCFAFIEIKSVFNLLSIWFFWLWIVRFCCHHRKFRIIVT